MPFVSRAQAKYMFANHPEIAKEWASKTSDIKALPKHVKSKKKKGESMTEDKKQFRFTQHRTIARGIKSKMKEALKMEKMIHKKMGLGC